MENREQEVGGVNFVAFEHTGFEYAQFDDAACQIAETDIGDADSALIACLGGGIEKSLVKILAQFVGRSPFGGTVDESGRLAFHIGEKRQKQMFRHDISGVVSGGLLRRIVDHLLEFL